LQENAFPNWKLLADHRWDLLVLYHCGANPSYMGKTIQQIAVERQSTPWDCICDLLLEEGAEMSRLMWCGRVSSQADIDTLIRQPDCMVISDGVSVSEVGALKDLRFSPIAFSWAASFLQKYVRDQRILDIVEAVGRLTWTPARRFRLEHRGELRAGYYADLAVFDLDQIHCHSTLENPNVKSTGVTHVFVNGTAVMRDASITEARPGKVLRRRA
jgi:N-acyl-D-amino-acid deacylase